MVTHGVIAEGAKERIEESDMEKLIITDTVEGQPEGLGGKVEVVGVGKVFGEGVNRWV
jgi:phosphoribosylpyrophosphate synthetase